MIASDPCPNAKAIHQRYGQLRVPQLDTSVVIVLSAWTYLWFLHPGWPLSHHSRHLSHAICGQCSIQSACDSGQSDLRATLSVIRAFSDPYEPFLYFWLLLIRVRDFPFTKWGYGEPSSLKYSISSISKQTFLKIWLLLLAYNKD